MVEPSEHERRERVWLELEVARYAHLSDAERVRIVEDLWLTAEAIRATKSTEQLHREELARLQMDEEGRARYRALAERLE
ncbi:MAG TPA: hypothetical protein VK348_06650 [Planctomycetota bacterium]|nr:hypothetical protein [Planctomycetota bacterium]